MSPMSLWARVTVCRDTPAAMATSLIVTRLAMFTPWSVRERSRGLSVEDRRPHVGACQDVRSSPLHGGAVGRAEPLTVHIPYWCSPRAFSFSAARTPGREAPVPDPHTARPGLAVDGVKRGATRP